jgi:hypothetical protein
MSRNKPKHRHSPQWEESLLEAYYDHCWREVLDPLYEQLARWKKGELEHEEVSNSIHQTHKQTARLYNLFIQKRDFLVVIAQQEQDWFNSWLTGHPAPSEVELRQLVPGDFEEGSQIDE